MLSKVTFVAVLLAAFPVFADDPKFVYGKVDDVKDVKKDVEWSATAEAGLLFSTGNSETTTITGGFHASRKTKDNKFALEGMIAYAKSGIRSLNDLNGNGLIDNANEVVTVETVTAETFASKARYDRYLDKTDSLFVAALASRDVPAGKESVYGGQLGYSRQLHKTKESESLGEFGYDYSHERLTSGTPNTNSIHSLRAFVGYKSKLTEGTDLATSLELLTNLNTEHLATAPADSEGFGGPFKDTRVNFHLEVSAKIGKNLAFSTSIDSKYDNRPAPIKFTNVMLAPGYVPEASSLDTIMKASIIYTFF
jgi:hypothetical protein